MDTQEAKYLQLVEAPAPASMDTILDFLRDTIADTGSSIDKYDQQVVSSLWSRLSPREREVCYLICADLTTKGIAAKLGISPETVKTHAEHILKKMGVPSRLALRLLLKDWGLDAGSGVLAARTNRPVITISTTITIRL